MRRGRRARKAKTKEKTGEKKKWSDLQKGKKAVIITAGSLTGALLIVYFAFAAYFTSHFYFGTKINGISCSMKTAQYVNKLFADKVKDYELVIKERDGVNDTITGNSVGLAYEDDGQVKKMIKKQSALLWPSAFFSKKEKTVTIPVAYDENRLEAQIGNLPCMDESGQTDPVNARPEYDGNQFVIQPEVYGTRIDRDKFTAEVQASLTGLKNELDIEKKGFYTKPQFTEDSKEVKTACDTMNTYIKANITYDVAPAQEMIDKTLISSWVSVDDQMQVRLNQGAVEEYVATLAEKYNTLGTTRSITTPGGKTTQVSGGTYGWAVDQEGEVQSIMDNIKNGATVSKELSYSQTGASHDAADWGNTYIEVDLSAQHMWYISGGAVVFETDVVTGQPIPEKETPAGVYNILEKERGKTLVGEIVPETGQPEYRTPVDYWARVTWTGIGFHDAPWQPAFGGSLYTTPAGSHGCINMPPSQIAIFYDMIDVGTPVVMHY